MDMTHLGYAMLNQLLWECLSWTQGTGDAHAVRRPRSADACKHCFILKPAPSPQQQQQQPWCSPACQQLS